MELNKPDDAISGSAPRSIPAWGWWLVDATAVLLTVLLLLSLRWIGTTAKQGSAQEGPATTPATLPTPSDAD
jgi:hypothetical protein